MRMLDSKEVLEILSLKEDDITQKKLVELFAATRQGEAKYETNDRFILPARRFFNDKEIETTVGRYIFNMFTLPESYLKKYGYMNEPLAGGALGDLETKMVNMIVNKEAEAIDYLRYMRKCEWIAGATVPYTAPTFDVNTVDNLPEVMAMKERLNREYADKIAEGDKNVLSMIGDKLIAEAKRVMSSNPEKYKTYEWAKAGIYNIDSNYRKTNIATGLQRKPSNENEYFYVDSNYADGLAKKDYANNSNLAIIGGLSRGLDSAESGYSSKKILGAMSTWKVDKDLEDCGTKHFLEVEIPKGYETFFYYRWVYDGGRLVYTTEDNINKYVGKKIKLRSPLYCKGDHVCRTCAGDFLEKIGVGYEGLSSFEIADVLVNSMMKALNGRAIV